MKVAFLGPEGTYTHQAASEFFGEFEPVPCDSIKETVEADADAAVIPFENSLGGGVAESVDMLREKDLKVTGEQKIKINHVLASEEEDIEEIETVKSHHQALTQCREQITGHEWETEDTSSTAGAADKVGEGEAAVCSRKAAEINDLNIILEGLQDKETNTTRFLILNGEETEGDKSSLILEPGEDRPGLLSNMLSCFSGHGINLSYIESRPTKEEIGNYYFYIEAEAGKNSERFKKAVKCLETYSDVRVLGSYKGEDIK